MSTFALCLTALVFMGVTGCVNQPEAPAYQWPGTRRALETINDRMRKIETFSTQARLIIEPPDDGGPVTLDAALAAKRPDQFRIQAFKFDRKMLDLLARQDELWLWSAERIDQDKLDKWLDRMKQVDRASKARSAKSAMAGGGPWLGPLMSRLPIERIEVVENDPQAGRLVVRWPIRGHGQAQTSAQGDGSPDQARAGRSSWFWLAVIDRPTLTVKQYRLLNDQRRVVQRLTLGDYRVIDGIAWPTNIRGRGRVQIDLRLNDTRFNTNLPAAAFEPPPQAKQLR